MRLLSFTHEGEASYGIAGEDGIVDLGRRLGGRYADLKALIAQGGLGAAAELAGAAPDLAAEAVDHLPVIPNPGKILCIGLNYKAHIAETGRTDSEHPVIFLRLPGSQVGHEQPLVRPFVSSELDFEGEIAVIIGRRGRHVAPQEAMGLVAGYACYNDGSVRDWQRHTHQFTPGKNFVGTGGFGPFMVTADAIPEPAAMRLTTRLNGEVMQDATVDMMVFPIAEQIAYISTWCELEPGDVIVTGTPGGVGSRRNPPVFLKAGDVVEVEVSGVGVLRNPVVDEPRPGSAR